MDYKKHIDSLDKEIALLTVENQGLLSRVSDLEKVNAELVEVLKNAAQSLQPALYIIQLSKEEINRAIQKAKAQ
jgi:hypothetical protein